MQAKVAAVTWRVELLIGSDSALPLEASVGAFDPGQRLDRFRKWPSNAAPAHESLHRMRPTRPMAGLNFAWAFWKLRRC